MTELAAAPPRSCSQRSRRRLVTTIVLLPELGYRNVQVRVGDGYLGWPEAAPFDRIVVTAAPDHVPHPLIEQLKPGGRMVLPVGPDQDQELLVISKQSDGRTVTENKLPV